MGTDPKVAGIKVRDTYYDYSQLTPFERNVMRLVFTFYSFMRRNASFMLKELMENPNRFVQTLRYSRSTLMKEYNRQHADLLESDYLAGRLPGPINSLLNILPEDPFNPEGEALPIYDEYGIKRIVNYAPMLPYLDILKLNPMEYPSMEEYSNYLLGQVNPMIQGVAAGLTGRQAFGNMPIEDIQTQLSTHNFLRATLPGYSNSKDAAIEYKTLFAEDLVKTMSGKRRTGS